MGSFRKFALDETLFADAKYDPDNFLHVFCKDLYSLLPGVKMTLSLTVDHFDMGRVIEGIYTSGEKEYQVVVRLHDFYDLPDGYAADPIKRVRIYADYVAECIVRELGKAMFWDIDYHFQLAQEVYPVPDEEE